MDVYYDNVGTSRKRSRDLLTRTIKQYFSDVNVEEDVYWTDPEQYMPEFLRAWANHIAQPKDIENETIARSTMKKTAEDAMLASRTQLMGRRLKIHQYLIVDLHTRIDRLVDSITESNKLRKKDPPKIFMGKNELALMVQQARKNLTHNLMLALESITIWCLIFFLGLRMGTLVVTKGFLLRDNDGEYHCLCWKDVVFELKELRQWQTKLHLR